MTKKLLIYLALCFFLVACTEKQQRVSIYERKAADDSERRSGPAMLLYEQAEIDLDVNNNVIVTPPEKKDENLPPVKTEN